MQYKMILYFYMKFAPGGKGLKNNIFAEKKKRKNDCL